MTVINKYIFCYYFVLSTIIIGYVVSVGCPFMRQSYMAGENRRDLIQLSDDILNDEGILVSDGYPASIIFGSSSIETLDYEQYRNSTTLLFAQQFYNEIFLTGNVSSTSTDSLTMSNKQKLAILSKQSKCLPEYQRCYNPAIKCNHTIKFSRLDGLCNNILNPKWGAKSTPYGRLLPANYNDGLHVIRKSITNKQLPSARLLSNNVLQYSTFKGFPKQIANYASFKYGMLIAHDVGQFLYYQSKKGGDGYQCCSTDYKRMLPNVYQHFGCDPIEIPNEDPFYKQYKIGCLNHLRTMTSFPTDCKLKSAQQANAATHSLDLSNIYGSDYKISSSLRTFVNGLMKVNNDNLYPQTKNCTTSDGCYYAADGRGTLLTILAILQLMYIRFHNIIATQFVNAKPNWTDEEIFQETRRITIAVHQSITYNEWVPLYLGSENAIKRNLTCRQIGCRSKYDSTINLASLNEFSHGAFRKYHENTPESVNFYDSTFMLIESRPITQFTYGIPILQTKLKEILRGLIVDPIVFDKYNDLLRNRIFNNLNNLGLGYDMLSVDIQRGRDNGLNPYFKYVNLYLNKNVQSWFDLLGLIANENIQKLMLVYESVFDVDLFVGLLLEEKHSHYNGPIAQAILEEQFYRSKFGDRFFYSHENGPYPMTKKQLQVINEYTFARLTCETMDINGISQFSFIVPTYENPIESCLNFKMFDLNPWL